MYENRSCNFAEKKGKDRLEIANWRPITLLNLDNKLLTKTLGHRLKKVLPSLISKEQNGFEFIFKTFETFNFGDNFKKRIKILYREGRAAFQITGTFRNALI